MPALTWKNKLQLIFVLWSGACATARSANEPVVEQASPWQDVTPEGLRLDARFHPDDNYGVQDVLSDPRSPGTFYAFVCYQGDSS